MERIKNKIKKLDSSCKEERLSSVVQYLEETAAVLEKDVKRTSGRVCARIIAAQKIFRVRKKGLLM